MLRLARNALLLGAAAGLISRRRSVVARARSSSSALRWTLLVAGAGVGTLAVLAARRRLAGQEVAHLPGVLPLAPPPPSRKKLAREARRQAAEERDALHVVRAPRIHVEVNKPERLAVPLAEVVSGSDTPN